MLDYHVHKLVLLLCEGAEGRIERNRKERNGLSEEGIETDKLLINR